MDSLGPAIGAAVRGFRHLYGWTQLGLARASGVGQGNLSHLEAGHMQDIDVMTLVRLAQALEVPLDCALLPPACQVPRPSIPLPVWNAQKVGQVAARLRKHHEEQEDNAP